MSIDTVDVPSRTPLATSRLPCRIANRLVRHGLTTMEAVAVFTKEEIAQIHRIDADAIDEVERVLDSASLTFRDDDASRSQRARSLFSEPHYMPVGLATALTCEVWKLTWLGIATVHQLSHYSFIAIREALHAQRLLFEDWEIASLRKGLGALDAPHTE